MLYSIQRWLCHIIRLFSHCMNRDLRSHHVLFLLLWTDLRDGCRFWLALLTLYQPCSAFKPQTLPFSLFSCGAGDGCIRWISWFYLGFSLSLLFHVLMLKLFAASAQKRTTQGPHSPSSTNKGFRNRRYRYCLAVVMLLSLFAFSHKTYSFMQVQNIAHLLKEFSMCSPWLPFTTLE